MNKKIIVALCIISLIILVSCDKISDGAKKISGDKESLKNPIEVEESFIVEDDQSNELKIIVE